MGVIFYGICHDCKEYIDLDKFYAWDACAKHVQDLEVENWDDYKTDGWIYRSLRLHFFMSQHKKHCIEVATEHDFMPFDFPEYKEVCHWPFRQGTDSDVIDFTDPKASRLRINTIYGELIIDVRKGVDVNCFRFINGKRVDTSLLPATK